MKATQSITSDEGTRPLTGDQPKSNFLSGTIPAPTHLDLVSEGIYRANVTISPGLREVHFLHIGKTGGTAIKAALSRQLETSRYRLNLHNHRFSLANVPIGEKAFFFLRDPIARFVSGFFSRQRKGKHGTNEWNPTERETFNTFPLPNDLASALADTSSDNHGLALQAMEGVLHMSRLSNWYISRTYFESRVDDILFIGFQETLNADFEELKRLLDYPHPAPLPTDDHLAHKRPRGLDDFLEPQAVRALKEWYRPDFEFMELCRNFRRKRAGSG